MKKLLSLIPVLFIVVGAIQAQTTTDVWMTSGTDTLYGTLELPANSQNIPVVLMIAGSGPTDRNGNNPMMINNAYKMVADSLKAHGIASLRYDKRGIGASRAAGSKEADLRFENYVNDAIAWIRWLRNDKRFSSITVWGHSEGSLIGMMATAKGGADRFISVAGAGVSADEVLKRQLSQRAPQLADTCKVIIDALKVGHTISTIDPMLYSLFRPDIQPYLISWFRYNPQVEMAQVSKPVLIIQGTTDFQVNTADAANLARVNEHAQLSIIMGMNHVLKDAPDDLQQNFATYSNPNLPVNEAMITAIVDFVLKR